MRENEDWNGEEEESDRRAKALRFESFVMFDDRIFGCYRWKRWGGGTESSSIIQKRFLINSLLLHRTSLSRWAFISISKSNFLSEVTCKAFFYPPCSTHQSFEQANAPNWPISLRCWWPTLNSRCSKRLIKAAKRALPFESLAKLLHK
jgi:hypothetical protein